MEIFDVHILKNAEKDLKRLPKHIIFKLGAWIDGVKTCGLQAIIPGFHDESLKGSRKDQRSIRLNKAYRAIYCINENEEINIVEILEVTKHEY